MLIRRWTGRTSSRNSSTGTGGPNLRARLDGLTDDEYFWEPAENTWSVRPRGEGRAAVAAGSGDFVIDFAYPSRHRRR